MIKITRRLPQQFNFFIVALLFIAACPMAAQDLNKEVYVVRPYEPTLSDATKYNFLPSVSNLETTIPAFRYSITPRRLENSFEPEPIKAAKTVTTSLPKIYNSWLKLGLGNYSTPLAEFNISNLRSKEYSYGVFMHHKSSQGKISLPSDNRVKAGYVENNAHVYGKRFFSGSTLSGDLRFDQYAFSYYGYNTDILPGPIKLSNDSVRQRVFKPGVDIGIKSNQADPRQLNFDINASFDYFIDRLKNKEPDFIIKSTLTKEISGILAGLDLSVDYSKLKGSLDTAANTIIRFHPFISKSSADWQFNLGFEGAADISDITRFYIYPRANLDIIIVKDVLVPFVGVSGELQKNSYQHVFAENQFIRPGLSLKNTSSNFIVYAGLRGNISSVVRFRADANLTLYKNYHFFVNDTTLALQNEFTAEYDDINLITYHGQLVFAPKEGIEFMIDGKYFDYRTIESLKPWHQPDFTVEFDANYKLSNKLDVGAGLNLIGNRWVKVYPDKIKKLKPVFDANLNVNYHYSKLFSIFADFYNLTERSYMIWNQYPSQRFNFLFGFTYKL